jgi:outer membrane protein
MRLHLDHHRTLTRIGLGLMLSLAASSARSESLMEIYNMAVSNDPQFLAAGASLQASKEALPQSTANFLPTISATGSYGRYRLRYRQL